MAIKTAIPSVLILSFKLSFSFFLAIGENPDYRRLRYLLFRAGNTHSKGKRRIIR